MKLKQVILNFVMLLVIALIGIGTMGCKASASSARSVYAALKKEKGLADAKQWMVINEKEHGYLVLASQTSAKSFSEDKINIIYSITGGSVVSADADYNMYHVKIKDGSIHIKAVNVDPRNSDDTFWDFIFKHSRIYSIANSVQIYNSLKSVAEVIK